MTHQGKVVHATARDPMLPRLFYIEAMKRELTDTFTMTLKPADGGTFRFQPGQFNMLYAFGIGEVPISISGDPADPTALNHTIRAVGKTSSALSQLKPGDTVGVRGPFGSPWPIADCYGYDMLILGGGVGLAPLRPAINAVLAEREKFGNVLILYGARTPEDILFAKELRAWRSRFDLNCQVTVDRVTGKWNGRVGVVTQLLKGGGFDRPNTKALICGPEVMMRFGIQTLNEHGVTNDRIYVSMERNMKCAVGFCGHCQFGPTFVCKDGPVYRFDRIQDIFKVREL
ncbi:MAG: FAD/NAD(P)-binding protein [Rhodospirillaceae bacterium]